MYNVSTNKVKPNENLIKAKNNAKAEVKGNDFSKVLQEKINDNNKLNFTKHANMRLNSRKIEFSNEQLARINKGVDEAREKGIKDSLVLIDDIALVVNVKNNTVVTAMGKLEQDNKIFTNIDGAVII